MKIAVYCASSSKLKPEYYEMARHLGELMAQRGHVIVNGAGTMGLMGASANACLEAGGKAIGVIPQFMIDEGWAHRGMSELVVTKDMHERKDTILKMSDAVIVLPGGFGTLDELFDAATLKQLGIFLKPLIVLNTNGFYDHLIAHIDHAMEEQMLLPAHKAGVQVAATPEEALDMCENTPEWSVEIRKIAKI